MGSNVQVDYCGLSMIAKSLRKEADIENSSDGRSWVLGFALIREITR